MKTPRRLPEGLLRPLPLPDQNWRHITLDFIVKLPRSNGCDTILTGVDRRSKQARFIATVETMTAADTVNLFFREVVCQHGIPETVVSDRGPQSRDRLVLKLGTSGSKEVCFQGKDKIALCLLRITAKAKTFTRTERIERTVTTTHTMHQH
jgi:hypothetical protein